jgi:hypothetical protein
LHELPASHGRRRRNFLLAGLAAIVTMVGAGYGSYHFLYGRWRASTEDAYTNGNIVQVTSLVSGAIVEISVKDNALVEAGQTLVRLDSSDSEVSVAEAEAALARITDDGFMQTGSGEPIRGRTALAAAYARAFAASDSPPFLHNHVIDLRATRRRVFAVSTYACGSATESCSDPANTATST